MLKTKKINGTDVIQFIVSDNVDQGAFLEFSDVLDRIGKNKDFKLCGTIANLSNDQELNFIYDVINLKFRTNIGLIKMAIIADNVLVNPIQSALKRRLPFLSLEVFEIEKEQAALNWLGV